MPTFNSPETRPAVAHFETPRLHARPFHPADAEAFAAYRAQPQVERYQSWSNYTLEQGRTLINSMQNIQPGTPGEWYQFALERRADGILIGDVALKVNDTEKSEAELGFTLAPEHQGHGYGREAVLGLLGYGFEQLHLHRILAVTDALNDSAARLLDRVGMRREAHFHENVFFKGTWGSEFVFGILDREWTAGPRSVPDLPPTESGHKETTEMAPSPVGIKGLAVK